MLPFRPLVLRLSLPSVALTTLMTALGASGCGEDEPAPGPAQTTTLYPGAPPLPGESECKVVITTGIQVAKASHVPVCTPVEYATNPPSGGPHWGLWAEFKRYEVPVPRPIYVHDLEHGAVTLLHRCASPCAEVTDMLQEVLDGAAPDPLCLMMPDGPHARVLMTPDSELDTPIAAAAWGATYTATCIDKASLENFVASAYAKGPENTCGGGVAIDDPDAGAPSCDAAAPAGGL